MTEHHTPSSPRLFKPDPTLRLAWAGFRRWEAPVWLMLLGAALVVMTWLPIAWSLEMRTNKAKPDPKIHFIQDMDNQPKYKTQEESDLFMDGRELRPRVPGAVARGELNLDRAYYNGFTAGASGAAANFLNEYPKQIQDKLNDEAQARALIDLGRAKFNITCALCHGKDGQGQGPIAVRAGQVGAKATGWVDPSNLTDELRRTRPNGHIYNTINNGIRTMGGYGHQLSPEERWAIVVYVRTLQLAQGLPANQLNDEQRRHLQ